MLTSDIFRGNRTEAILIENKPAKILTAYKPAEIWSGWKKYSYEGGSPGNKKSKCTASRAEHLQKSKTELLTD